MFGEKGMTQIYTGDGKGKTTAALGLAFRAAGHGARVVIIQFMKGWDSYGELKTADIMRTVTLIQTGRPDYVYRGEAIPEDFAEAERGLQKAETVIEKNECDLLILDEILVALDYGLISRERVLSLIKNKPEKMELVMTGRGAPKELTDAADLVTEMKKIKHPYDLGVISRKGVEY